MNAIEISENLKKKKERKENGMSKRNALHIERALYRIKKCRQYWYS